jgi:hypothetical protein
VSSIIGTLAGLGLANVSSLCARVARTIEGRGLKISPVGLIRTPRPQQPRLLRVSSSPITRSRHRARAFATITQLIHYFFCFS